VDRRTGGDPILAGVSGSEDTADESASTGFLTPTESAWPGLLLIFARGKPVATPVHVHRARDLGRDDVELADQHDARMSRRHVRLERDGHKIVVHDLGSRNGTSVDGVPLEAGSSRVATRVVRIGDCLLVPVKDLRAFERFGVKRTGDRVEGPALQEVLAQVALAATVGRVLHIVGESGAGKEGVARAFHDAGPSNRGSFVAVNCATVPESLAERLFFGTKRGAYSGADRDAEGYVRAAHHGTLFLDEVAEVHASVQPKLLRVLESGELLPLGAAHAETIDLRFCSATHRDLRARVGAGLLREDLYFRIAKPRVVVPPLRERPEEIPWLLEAEVLRVAPGLGVHLSFVETSLLRAWPGNVRELLAEARDAALAAVATGATRVEASHLSSRAGSAYSDGATPAAQHTASQIEKQLKHANGNVSAAARDLGLHRTQLRRLIARFGIDTKKFGDDSSSD
jgi:hypothetical protein